MRPKTKLKKEVSLAVNQLCHIKIKPLGLHSVNRDAALGNEHVMEYMGLRSKKGDGKKKCAHTCTVLQSAFRT